MEFFLSKLKLTNCSENNTERRRKLVKSFETTTIPAGNALSLNNYYDFKMSNKIYSL